MKFIHIADIHLGRIPDQGKPWSEKRSREIFESFYGVLQICKEQDIDLLLIAGDLFHRQPLLRELRELNYQFSKLTHTEVILMAGNHDYISEHSHYQNFAWAECVVFLGAKEMEQVYISRFQTTVYGFSYHQRDITKPMYDDVTPNRKKGFHILLAHGGDEKNVPMNKKLIGTAGFDYVALGHIHKPERISDGMAYSGSLEPLDRNEIGEHGYILGELKEDGTRNITFHPFAKSKYHHLTVQVEPEMTKGAVQDMIHMEMERLGMQHIYKIILTGIRDAAITFDEINIESIGNIIEMDDQTIPDYDFEVLQYHNRDNVIGMFIEAIRQCGQKDEIADKALYYGMEALLNKNR